MLDRDIEDTRQPPEYPEPPDLRYINKKGEIVCRCDVYEFPHRANSGKCTTCDGCDEPKANCRCTCYMCGRYPCQCRDWDD